MRTLRFLGPVVIVFFMIGCSGDGLKRVKVKGKVTAKGQPVDHATVVFVPAGTTKGLGGLGGSDDQGNFSVSGATDARKTVEGLVPGDYTVRVTRMVTHDGKPLPPDAPEADNPGCKETVPLKYSSPNSGIKVTVPESGEVSVDIPEGLVKGGIRRR